MQADILVSELLGSFGDNELSPECLDGAQRFLKPDTGTAAFCDKLCYIQTLYSMKCMLSATIISGAIVENFRLLLASRSRLLAGNIIFLPAVNHDLTDRVSVVDAQASVYLNPTRHLWHLSHLPSYIKKLKRTMTLSTSRPP